MANFDASGADTGVLLTLLGFGYDGQDPLGSNDAQHYSWITNGGHDIEATGTGISFNNDPPTTGTIDALIIDLGDDGDMDVDVSGLSASLVVMTSGATGFLDEVLGGDDTMVGSSFADLLKGAGGDDGISGGGGNDTIVAGSGHDTVTGGNGAASRKPARKPTNCVTRISGPGVVSARPSPSTISGAVIQ